MPRDSATKSTPRLIAAIIMIGLAGVVIAIAIPISDEQGPVRLAQEAQTQSPMVTASSLADGTFAPIPKPIEQPPEPPRTNTVQGIVVNERGVPIPWANVSAMKHQRNDEPLQRTTRSDLDGIFVMEDLQPDGRWYFSCEHPHYAVDWRHGVELPVQVDRDPFEFELKDPHDLEGIVVDERGEPVSNVHIAIYLRWHTQHLIRWMGKESYELQATQSGDDGKFLLPRLWPGKFTLILEHPDFAQTRAYDVPVNKGIQQVTIQKGTTLKGIVTAKGEPVPRATVRVAGNSDGGRSYGNWETVTNEDGFFRSRAYTEF